MSRTALSRLLLAALLLFPALAPAAGALTDFAGNPRTIEDYAGKGRWLVVMLWAYDCPVCNAEVHRYNDFHVFHQDGDAAVLGISVDGPQFLSDAQAFVDRHELEFPNLIGTIQSVDQLYRGLVGRPFSGTPTFLVYDPSGKLVAQQVGIIPVQALEDLISRSTPTAPKS